MKDKTKFTVSGKALSINDEDKTLTAVISTNSVDRDGDIVEPMGLKFANYEKNPVVLWAHDMRTPPIGKVIEITRSEKTVMATIQFADSPRAKEIFNLYSQGMMSTWSIGFAPDREKSEALMSGDGMITGFHIKEAEMVELSAVPVPANPDALTRCIKSIEDVEIKTDLAKLFDIELESEETIEDSEETSEESTEDSTESDSKQLEEKSYIKLLRENKDVVKSLQEQIEKGEKPLGFIKKYGTTETLVYSSDKTIKDTAFKKSIEERGSTGKIPVQIVWAEKEEKEATYIEFEVMQEDEVEIKEVKIKSVLMVSKPLAVITSTQIEESERKAADGRAKTIRELEMYKIGKKL